MEKELKQESPYKENEEDFGRWFREEAGDKWLNYLKGNEGGISIEERDAMRKFLIEYGTKEEIQTKLDSFGFNVLADEALRAEIKSKHPDTNWDQ